MSVRRMAWVTGAAAIALLASREARADDESGVLDSRHHRYESPQHFAFEFRVARYLPDVDSDPAFGGKHPYADVFGTTPRIEIAAELDWQILRIPHVGTIGPGISAGYTSIGAQAQYTNGTGESPEGTSLDIFPFYGVAVLRIDAISRELHIPVVPYVKGGLGMALWRSYNDLSTSVSRTTGAPARGHTVGTHFAIGGALTLDAFDQAAARNLDNEIGINHTYLFLEYFMSDLNGLGQSNVLFVGTRNFAGGLAFEF